MELCWNPALKFSTAQPMMMVSFYKYIFTGNQALSNLLSLVVSPFVTSSPFPSSLVRFFQNESKCETFHMKNEFCMQFHFHVNQIHFPQNGFALRLALKQRLKWTWKWPIWFLVKKNLARMLTFWNLRSFEQHWVEVILSAVQGHIP